MKKTTPQLFSTESTVRTFKSLNTGQDITPAAYIAEVVCQKKAESENNGTLPKSYWNNPKYKAHFKSQIVKASQLLKKYSVSAITNALKHNKCWSLRVKWLEDVIKREQRKIDEEVKNRKTTVVEALPERKKQQGKKTLFGEL